MPRARKVRWACIRTPRALCALDGELWRAVRWWWIPTRAGLDRHQPSNTLAENTSAGRSKIRAEVEALPCYPGRRHPAAIGQR